MLIQSPLVAAVPNLKRLMTNGWSIPVIAIQMYLRLLRKVAHSTNPRAVGHPGLGKVRGSLLQDILESISWDRRVAVSLEVRARTHRPTLLDCKSH